MMKRAPHLFAILCRYRWPIPYGLFAAIFFAGMAAADVADPTITLSIGASDVEETVYEWQSMRCEDWDIPDSPARAWRDWQGRARLMASHNTNRAMSGASLNALYHDCRVSYEGGQWDEPARHDDRGWIASTYTVDGRQVFALIHNEFHGHRRAALCPAQDYMKCWRNSITLAVSNDGGLTFSNAPGSDHLVAGLPYRYMGAEGKHSGYFAPSNILSVDGYYYAFIWTETYGAQTRGACLMRTPDLADPRAWRAWDGSSFTTAFADAEREQVDDATRHVCAPVASGRLIGIVSSVTRHKTSGLYIAMMAVRQPPGEGRSPTGIYYATSADLINWSPPVLLQATPILVPDDCSDTKSFYYPSLIDSDSASRNFEDTGDRAYLYLTKIYLDNCKVGMKRDLVRLPVVIGAGH